MSHHSHQRIATPYENKKYETNNINQTQASPSSSSFPLSTSAESTEECTMNEESQVRIHIMAGGAAGIMEHCVMYPVDSVKVSDDVLPP